MTLYLVIVCVVLVLSVLVLIGYRKNQESFDGQHEEDDISIHPDLNLRNMLMNIRNKTDTKDELDVNDYVKKTAVEQSARAVAREYCPVTPDFDPTQYIKKTEIKDKTCPNVPDLKDYVLKSSIPPLQQCPSCVCPKVKVAGGLCKKCPDPKMVCPPPQPCGYDECKNVIKCGPNDKLIPPCPKCPEVKPCAKDDIKICPAIKLPSPDDLKCPPPKPCPVNGKDCPKCTYMGVKQADNNQDVVELINGLLNKADNKSRETLKYIKSELNKLNFHDPNKLQKTIDDNMDDINGLKAQLAAAEAQVNAASLASKGTDFNSLNSKLNKLLENDAVETERNLRRNNGEETDDDEPAAAAAASAAVAGPASATTVRPHNAYASKCQSKPLNVKKYDSYRVVGGGIV
jgi:hypothetical protein